MTDVDTYTHRGARALVLLHDRHLREFVATWQEARRAGLTLPACDDPSYASLEELLRHVLRAARGYMTWICEELGLPDPAIDSTPEAAALPEQVESYTDHVLERWRHPLVGITEEQADRGVYASRWGTEYCIDAMMEHAVMHPIRHTFQLREWLDVA